MIERENERKERKGATGSCWFEQKKRVVERVQAILK